MHLLVQDALVNAQVVLEHVLGIVPGVQAVQVLVRVRVLEAVLQNAVETVLANALVVVEDVKKPVQILARVDAK